MVTPTTMYSTRYVNWNQISETKLTLYSSLIVLGYIGHHEQFLYQRISLSSIYNNKKSHNIFIYIICQKPVQVHKTRIMYKYMRQNITVELRYIPLPHTSIGEEKNFLTSIILTSTEDVTRSKSKSMQQYNKSEKK